MKYSLLLSKRRPETSRYGKEVKMSQTATAGRVAGHFSAFALFHVCEGRYLCKIRSHSTKRSKSESRQERLNEQWIISLWQFVLETPRCMKLTSYQCFLTAAHRKWDVLLFCLLNTSRSMCWKKSCKSVNQPLAMSAAHGHNDRRHQVSICTDSQIWMTFMHSITRNTIRGGKQGDIAPPNPFQKHSRWKLEKAGKGEELREGIWSEGWTDER